MLLLLLDLGSMDAWPAPVGLVVSGMVELSMLSSPHCVQLRHHKVSVWIVIHKVDQYHRIFVDRAWADHPDLGSVGDHMSAEVVVVDVLLRLCCYVKSLLPRPLYCGRLEAAFWEYREFETESRLPVALTCHKSPVPNEHIEHVQ